MSRLHRQKLRQRARDVHSQFARSPDADAAPATVDAIVKPSRAKRTKRKAVRKTKSRR